MKILGFEQEIQRQVFMKLAQRWQNIW